ncbi:hypothetical protein [Zhongshania sp.]|uniref:hypothetical protein n=1 Tax=Zhongshania sp. TaxID=1971902 RepID=UPI00356AF85B
MLLRWLGVVANIILSRKWQMCLARRDGVVLIIVSEATRSKVARWKGGYYHIAGAAGVPIVATALGYAKHLSLSAPYFPSGSCTEGQRQPQEFYWHITAKYLHLDCSCPTKISANSAKAL